MPAIRTTNSVLDFANLFFAINTSVHLTTPFCSFRTWIVSWTSKHIPAFHASPNSTGFPFHIIKTATWAGMSHSLNFFNIRNLLPVFLSISASKSSYCSNFSFIRASSENPSIQIAISLNFITSFLIFINPINCII